jgi:hypothetical protein
MKCLALLLAVLLAAPASADKARHPKASSTPQIWPPGPDDEPKPKPKPVEPAPPPPEELPAPPAPPPAPPAADEAEDDGPCAEAFDDCREDCTITHATDDTLHLRGKHPPIVKCIARCQAERDRCDDAHAAGFDAAQPHRE